MEHGFYFMKRFLSNIKVRIFNTHGRPSAGVLLEYEFTIIIVIISSSML